MNSENDEYLSVADLRKMLKSVDPRERTKLTDIIEKILKKPIILPDSDLTHASVRGFKKRIGHLPVLFRFWPFCSRLVACGL
jgi:hypothetical protein